MAEEDIQQEEEDDTPSAPFWMTTYGDMVTLLLTFFVLMFAMSSVDVEKFRAAAASLRGQLGVLQGNISMVGENSPMTGTTGVEAEDLELVEAQELLEELFERGALQSLGELETVSPGETRVSMGEELFFDAGAAALKPEAQVALSDIYDRIKGQTSEIRVAGHTDNRPINTAQYPSNWELSAARAAVVVRYLQSLGAPPDQLVPVGRAEYQPIASNATADGRARNRRVELYITWSDEVNE